MRSSEGNDTMSVSSNLEEIKLQDESIKGEGKERRPSLIQQIVGMFQGSGDHANLIKKQRRRSLQRFRQHVLGAKNSDSMINNEDQVDCESAIKVFYVNERNLKYAISTLNKQKSINQSFVTGNRDVGRRLDRLLKGPDESSEGSVIEGPLTRSFGEFERVSVPALHALLKNLELDIHGLLSSSYNSAIKLINERKGIVIDLDAHKFHYNKIQTKIEGNKGKAKGNEYAELEVREHIIESVLHI